MAPRAITEAEIDPIAEQVDRDMTETGEEVGVAQHKFSPEVIPVGASGQVIFDKRLREPGRPTVRAVWTWDGRPSMIPLAYTPSGKQHDGGRKYLLKRHCTVCNNTGFYGQVCPQCQKDGRRLAPPTRAFYLRREDVPHQETFYGVVDCFVPACVRRGEYGFLNEAQMRQHAMSRHRMEYRAFMDSQQNRNENELAALRAQVTALTAAALQGNGRVQRAEPSEAQRQAARDRMSAARAARKGKMAVKAAGGVV